MRNCIVRGCITNDDTGKTLFRVPEAIEKKTEWLVAVNRQDLLTAQHQLSVCEDHFKEEDLHSYSRSKSPGRSFKKLSPGAKPHIETPDIPAAVQADADIQFDDTDLGASSEYGHSQNATEDGSATGPPALSDHSYCDRQTDKEHPSSKIHVRSKATQTIRSAISVGTNTLRVVLPSKETQTDSPDIEDLFDSSLEEPSRKRRRKNVSDPTLHTSDLEPERVEEDQELDSDVEVQNRDEFHDVPVLNPAYEKSENVAAENYADERKFIVFEQAIDALLLLLQCKKCGSGIETANITKNLNGSCLIVTVLCPNGHFIAKWRSQPVINRVPVGNILISASILYSGKTITPFTNFAEYMNLAFITKRSFFRHQNRHLFPTVKEEWRKHQEGVLEELAKEDSVKLSGDGRCDSPGHSATYLTYTVMDMKSDKVVDFRVVNSKEVDGKSNNMEKLGCREVLKNVTGKGIKVKTLATDRHPQIRTLVRDEFEGIDQQYDVWHLVRNVREKLRTKSKQRGCEALAEWIEPVTYHIWFCAAGCKNNPETLIKMWEGCLQHSLGIHEWDGGKCSHKPLPAEEQRKRKWLKEGSRAHQELTLIVNDTRLQKDLRHLSEFCHTGELEVLHAMLTKYLPKRLFFSEESMIVRTMLANLDHNSNVSRLVAKDKSGADLYRFQYRKYSKKWVARVVYEAKCYDFAKKLVKNTLSHLQEWKVSSTPQLVSKTNRSFAVVPCGNREWLKQNLMSRYGK